jgi:hypothetical protein
MSSILDIPFSQGYVSTGDAAKNAYDLAPGELVTMTGAFYRKNDPSQPWKMPGRALFGSAGSTIVKGIAICQFDSGGTDKLLASIGTTVVAATPGATGTFSSLITGLNASATRFTACHQDDRWYLGNGYDKNKCLKPDGTTRDMGMATPQEAPAAVASAIGLGALLAPNANSGSFVNPTLAYDLNDSTFAGGTRSTAGSVSHTWTWAADTNIGRALRVIWGLAGFQQPEDSGDAGAQTIGTGGTVDSGYRVTVLLEQSTDSGVTWTTVISTTRNSPTFTTNYSRISDGINLSAVQFKATLTYLSGTNAATLQIKTVEIGYGATIATFDETAGIYYAYTEYDSVENLESPPSAYTQKVTFTAKNIVTLTRGPQVNTNATHWRIYRIGSGVTRTLTNLGLLMLDTPIATTTAVDSFTQAVTLQATPIIPLLTVGDLPLPRDTQPPAFLSMISWKGSVCGISRTERRTYRYSEAGRPESFPEFYVVSSFPIDEHDALVGHMAVGETLVLLMEGAVLAIEDLPRVVNGEFNGAEARPIKGHPGCVGEYAYTTFSVAGEPRGAWVSPYGVYITNGQTCACISTDLAWESEVDTSSLASAVLRWDAKNLILWFEFDLDGDGLNDREMPFHMAQAHSKGEAMPKLGQPTAKASSCMASALIGATHYRFSGHPSNGAVYVEESGYQDAATATNVAMTLKTGKITAKKTDLAIVKATVLHSNFGTGATGTLTTTLYRDAAKSSNTRTNTLDLYGARGNTVFIGRAGEAVDFQIQYSGSGTGGILGIQAEVDGQGRSGSAQRWVSTSATP